MFLAVKECRVVLIAEHHRAELSAFFEEEKSE